MTRQADDLVLLLQEFLHEVSADEAGRAKDEDPHQTGEAASRLSTLRNDGSKGIKDEVGFRTNVYSSILATLIPFVPLSFHNFLPPIVVGILVIIVIIFVIKSLIKFAIIIGVIALAIFLAWQFGLFSI